MKLFEIALEEDELNIDKYFEIKKDEEKEEDNPQLIEEKKELEDNVNTDIKDNDEKGIDVSTGNSSSDNNIESSDGDFDMSDDFDMGDDESVSDETKDEDKIEDDTKEDKETSEEVEEEEKDADKEDDKPATESYNELSDYQKDLIMKDKVNSIKTNINNFMQYCSETKEKVSQLKDNVPDFSKMFDDDNKNRLYYNKDTTFFKNVINTYKKLANNFATDENIDPLKNVSLFRDNFITIYVDFNKLASYFNNLIHEEYDVNKKDIAILLTDLNEPVVIPGGYTLNFNYDVDLSITVTMSSDELKDVDSIEIEDHLRDEIRTMQNIFNYLVDRFVLKIDELLSKVSSFLNDLSISDLEKDRYIKIYETYYVYLLNGVKDYTDYTVIKLQELADFFIDVNKKLDYAAQDND